MIDAALAELEPVLGVKPACGLLGRSRARHYRALQPPMETVRRPPASPPNALTRTERGQVLALLRAPEHCDFAVAQVWARELDEGRYYCSISTMYRILRGEVDRPRVGGEAREDDLRALLHGEVADVVHVELLGHATNTKIRRRANQPTTTTRRHPTASALRK